MANNTPPTYLPLHKLFEKWEYARNRAAFWHDMLTAFPEDDATALYFAKHDMREKFFYAEIERRADLLPPSVLESLGCTFSFNPKSIH